MNKTELVANIAELAKLTKTEAERALDAFTKVVENSLSSGEEVRLIGFGTFCTIKREATTGHNPKTGEKINIPAKIAPKFKPGKQLKDAVSK